MNNKFQHTVALFCENLPASFRITSKLIQETGIEDFDDNELLLFFHYVEKELITAEGNLKNKLEALEAEINFIFEARERNYKIL